MRALASLLLLFAVVVPAQEPAVAPKTGAADEERAARTAVLQLVSERPDQRAAGASAIERLGGREIGTDPVAARTWFHRRFGKGVDLLAGVPEPGESGGRAFLEDENATAPLRASLQSALDTRVRDLAPGAQAAVVMPDGRLIALATGVADRDAKPPPPMRVHGRLLAGSTGKTFFAALALQLVREQKLSLDQRVATWFGDEPWFTRLPNGKDVTVRHLMQHRSGLVRYEFQDAFVKALIERPDHRFSPLEELAFVPDAPARFAAGEGFEYSDTNYVLLGLVLERLTGRPNYDEIARRFLVPLALRDTVPGVGRRIPGLVQGYAGANNPFGRRDAMLVDGELPFDAGFEGAGGGFASSAADLARWAKHLYEGDVLDGVRDEALAGVPAPLGKDAMYGLGVIVDPTPLGTSWGHRGFFPGWRSDMRYFPELQVAVAVLVNTSAGPRVGPALRELAIELARLAAGR